MSLILYSSCKTIIAIKELSSLLISVHSLKTTLLVMCSMNSLSFNYMLLLIRLVDLYENIDRVILMGCTNSNLSI